MNIPLASDYNYIAQHNNQETMASAAPSPLPKTTNRRSLLQDQLGLPQATIREYLNTKRSTKDKCMLISFCVYMLVLVMITGICFFYGNPNSLGLVVSLTASNSTYFSNLASYGLPQPSNNYSCVGGHISQDYSTCYVSCTQDMTGSTTTIGYLQIVCVQPNYAPTQSAKLTQQIDTFSFKYCFYNIFLYSIGVLISSIVLFAIIVCLPKVIYLYILLAYGMLLGFSFYLLKSTQSRLSTYSIVSGSIFQTNERQIVWISYVLLAVYLVTFPLILFTPARIDLAIKVLIKLRVFFLRVFTLMFFQCLVVAVGWALFLVLGTLIISLFTAGNPVVSADSFFYLYQGQSLTHPALLVFYFFGIYWFFMTFISWNKYFVSSSMCMWYFNENQSIKPIKRGVKRSWYHVGSASIDALFMPFSFILFMIYSITKIPTDLPSHSNDQEVAQNTEISNATCCGRTSHRFRMFFNRLYSKFNRNSHCSAVLTNQTYFQSCQISAVTFQMGNHKFFGIGSTISTFLTLFCTLFWLVVMYFVLYLNIYIGSYPPAISSLSYPMIYVIAMGWIVGQLLSNILASVIDTLLFCFLIDLKNGGSQSKNQIKKIVQGLFFTNQKVKKIEMYQLQSQDDNDPENQN